MDDQKTCCLCKRPVSGLGNKRLDDGAWVCKSCVASIEALSGSSGFDYGSVTQQQLAGRVAQMTQADAWRKHLYEVMDQRKAQFVKTRSFDGPEGPLVTVDDTHGLVRFPANGVMAGKPAVMMMTLATAELVNARATAGADVCVVTNIAGLPPLIMPIAAPDGGIDEVGGFLLGGFVGAMVANSQQEQRDQHMWQVAAAAAEFVNGVIRPSTPAASPADELIKWKSLLDSGGITQDEYDAKKKQLLGLG